eukprot:scaffold260_cov274-Pinguiococcus_pyrenoidosus.AAC.11
MIQRGGLPSFGIADTADVVHVFNRDHAFAISVSDFSRPPARGAQHKEKKRCLVPATSYPLRRMDSKQVRVLEIPPSRPSPTSTTFIWWLGRQVRGTKLLPACRPSQGVRRYLPQKGFVHLLVHISLRRNAQRCVAKLASGAPQTCGVPDGAGLSTPPAVSTMSMQNFLQWQDAEEDGPSDVRISCALFYLPLLPSSQQCFQSTAQLFVVDAFALQSHCQVWRDGRVPSEEGVGFHLQYCGPRAQKVPA